jgi:hypothetical protein
MMEIRNPIHNNNGTINCEVNHPRFGWVPFTASPNDVEEYGRELYAELIAGVHGEIAPYEG